MFTDDRGQSPPPTKSSSFARPDSIEIREVRDVARAFALGQFTSHDDQSRASRRGDLPDVDFASAVRVRGSSIWARFAAAFRAFRADVAVPTTAESGASLTLRAGASVRPTDNIVPFRRTA